MMNVTFNRRAAIASGVSATAASWLPSATAQPVATQSPETQWWGWRGPTANNHAAAGTSLPVSLSADSIAWSIDLPGRGHSTPIVVGDALYMATADKAAGTQSVLAVGDSGEARWATTVHQGGLPAENHRKNTEASSTLAFDGESLFATFYNSGAIRLTKLTTEGRVVWQRDVGQYSPNQYKYGYAASPLLYGDSVIVVGDYDGNAFLTAVDRRSGQPIWKIKRPGKLSFSSPIVTSIGGSDQLLLSGAEMVAAYDPNNGQLLWSSPGATTMATCGTMVWDGDVVFASGGYPEPETVAIAADGSGRVIWSNRVKCYEQSMLAHKGYVFAVDDNGVAHCWRGSDGATMWRERLGGKYSSSPLLVGDSIIVFNESGQGFVYRAVPDGYQRLAGGKLADEVFASPIVVGQTLYLRVAVNAGKRQEKLLAMR